MSEQAVALREMAETMREIGKRAEEGTDLEILRPALIEFQKGLGAVIGDPGRSALAALVRTINNTGGVVMLRNGELAPVGDEEWLDLGAAYELACKALGEEPVVVDAG